MNIELRWCNKCKRETLQVRVSRSTNISFYEPLTYKVWYCPCCGTRWIPNNVEQNMEDK